jgi:DNA-directed RNA polymerase alpha subunit
MGYHLSEELRKKNMHEKLSLMKPTTLLVDSIFMPVKKVNYKIKLIHDSFGNIKESLFLEIVTNGSLSPKRSLQEAIKVLIHLYYPLLLTPEISILSSYYLNQLKKKSEKIISNNN